MKRTKKRIASILLSMAMVIALFAVMPMTALAATDYKIGGADDSSGFWYTDLDDLLGDVTLATGDTITLLDDVTGSKRLHLVSINIIINLAGKTLEIDVNNSDAIFLNYATLTVNGPGYLIAKSTTDINTAGIYVEGGTLSISGGATVHATGTTYGGVLAIDGGKATVSSATTTAADGIGVRAEGTGSSVTVNGNVTAAGQGVVTNNSGYVTVNGNVTAASTAVLVNIHGTVVVTGNVKSTNLGDASAVKCNEGTIIIDGNVTAEGQPISKAVDCTDEGAVIIGGNVDSKGNGVFAGIGSNVTIDGTITVPSSGIYIQISGINKTKADFTTPTTKEGYLTYSTSSEQDFSTVWVKEVISPPPTDGAPGGTPTTNVPQTGENATLWWTALLIGSLLFLAVISIMYFRKRHTNSNETR